MLKIYLKLISAILINISIGITIVVLTQSPGFATFVAGFFTAWAISMSKEEIKQLKLKDLSA